LKVVAEDQEMAKEKTESINSPEISIDKEKVIHAPVLQNSPKEASLTKSVKNLARIISAKLKQTKKERDPKTNYNSAIQEFYSEFFNRLFKENREMERLFEDFNMEKHGKMFAEQIDQLILLVQKLSNSEIKSSIQKSIEFFKSKGMSRRILIQGSAIFMQTLCLLLDEPDSISDEQTTIAWIHLISMILDIALPALTDISKKKKKHQSRTHSFSDNNSLRSHSASLVTV
jgi:hypothetical protein